jgi:hypothetical protein
MEGIEVPRPSGYRRMLGAIESVEEVSVEGESEPRRIYMARFPSIFGSGEERVAVSAAQFEIAGIEPQEGTRFMAWAIIDAEKAEEVQPVDFEPIEFLTEEEMESII